MQRFISLLNRSYTTEWLEDPINASIDPVQCKRYIESFNDSRIQSFVREVITNIERITFKKFYDTLLECIACLLTKFPGKFILAVDLFSSKEVKPTITSNHWVLALVWPLIKHVAIPLNIYQKHFSTRERQLIDSTDNVVFLDDCVYSGTQMSQNVDNARHVLSNKKTYIVAAPYMNPFGKSKLENNRVKTIFIDYTTPTTSIDLKPIFPGVSSKKAIRIVNSALQGDYESLSLVYFDHKIPDYKSTYYYLLTNGENCEDYNPPSEENEEEWDKYQESETWRKSIGSLLTELPRRSGLKKLQASMDKTAAN